MALNRSIFTMLVPGFAAQGLGANAILRAINPLLIAMPDVGMGVQRQWGLATIRRITGKMKHEDAVKALPADVKPGRHLMVETELKRARKYRVYGTANYEDTVTGEVTVSNVSFYTDTLGTKEDWSDDFIRQTKTVDYLIGKDVVGMDIKAIEHNEDMAY